MKTMILCGGEGIRIREKAEMIPKPMIQIGGSPILLHIMLCYSHYGLKDFLLCTGHLGFKIKEYFLNLEACMRDVSVRFGEQPGVEYHGEFPAKDWAVTLTEAAPTVMTGARLRVARQYLDEGPFCLAYGDCLSNINLKELIRFHRSHGKLGTVTGVYPPGRFGELCVEGQKVTRFDEKPPVGGDLINGGFMVLERSFIDRYLDDRDDLTLEREPLQRLAADGELMVYEHDGFWMPMDTFREWKILEEMWQSGRAPWRIWE